MTDGSDATKVQWDDWGQDAFDFAQRTERPVLLSLVTRWAAESAEMDATTYDEPRIAANINDSFVPIRVDADRNPRVRERYNMGGFPSTVFLTPEGKIISGGTFLGIDGFREILNRVRQTWEQNGEAAGSVPRGLDQTALPGGELDARIEEHMIEQLLGSYDEEFGGWGNEAKFPMPRTIEFALVRARDQATETLDAIETQLLDRDVGGFYRVARNRNWSGVRKEKLLDENGALLRAFSRGYRYTGEERYREAAANTVEFLTTTMWTGTAFGASQAVVQGSFEPESTDRDSTETPTVDETVLADRNGIAIDGLLWYVAYTDDDLARQYARDARDHVCETLVDEKGRVTHYVTSTESGESGLLLDQACLLTGLTSAWEVLGEPGPARAVADWTIGNLRAENGAFVDGESEGAGLLDRPLYPLDTTVECAEALLDLSLLTGDDEYRAVGRDAIEAFAGAADRMGVEVAQYATASARFREPQVLEVGTLPGTDLHRAALRLADHETVVAPRVASGSSVGVADDVSDGVARLVTADQEQGRAESPAELETLLTA